MYIEHSDFSMQKKDTSKFKNGEKNRFYSTRAKSTKTSHTISKPTATEVENAKKTLQNTEVKLCAVCFAKMTKATQNLFSGYSVLTPHGHFGLESTW